MYVFETAASYSNWLQNENVEKGQYSLLRLCERTLRKVASVSNDLSIFEWFLYKICKYGIKFWRVFILFPHIFFSLDPSIRLPFLSFFLSSFSSSLLLMMTFPNDGLCDCITERSLKVVAIELLHAPCHVSFSVNWQIRSVQSVISQNSIHCELWCVIDCLPAF